METPSITCPKCGSADDVTAKMHMIGKHSGFAMGIDGCREVVGVDTTPKDPALPEHFVRGYYCASCEVGFVER